MSSYLLGAPESLEPESELAFDPREYLRLIISRWRLLALVCGLTLLSAVALYFITPPQYQASTILQIEQRNPLGIARERNPWLETWATVKYYPTQYRLLRSRGLAERVVVSLGLMDDRSFNPERVLLPSAEPTVEGDQVALASLANRVLGNLAVDPIDGTELVRITYKSTNPKLAARIANGFVQTFKNWEIDTRSANVGRTSDLLEDEIEALKIDLEDKERQLNEYGKNSDIVALDPSSNLTLQRLQKLNDDLTSATQDRIDKEAGLAALDAEPRESLANEESGGLIAVMKRQMIEKEREYEIKGQIYKPDFPAMIDLSAEIDERQRALAQEIDIQVQSAAKRLNAELQSARRREESLRREIDKVKSEAADLSQLTVEYNNLQMEIDAGRNLQDDLLRQLSESDLSARLSGKGESNIRVVDTALVPSAPFRPSLRRNLSIGLSGGLVVGIGLILLIHFLDRTVKSSEELERLLGRPVLAVIPDVGDSGGAYGSYGYGYGYGRRRKREQTRDRDDKTPRQIELVPDSRPRFAVSEAYRALRTAVSLSSAEELRVVTISSAEASEGKTATAVNLGVVMAQLGRTVLLVDADLRRPRLHKILKTSNRSGLVNYLTGGPDFEDIIVPTSISGMSFCPSGPHPPNPSELLASERMGELIETARAKFDFVIIDTPPVLAVTDAILSASATDGMVLCFRANKILREDIRACRNRLQLAGIKVLGAVLNRYQPHRASGHSRQYMYYEAYADEIDDDVSSSAA